MLSGRVSKRNSCGVEVGKKRTAEGWGWESKPEESGPVPGWTESQDAEPSPA